jgi:glycosyltransferase involved in cell wall biosynthesis
MVRAFAEMKKELPAWDYFCVGGLDDSECARNYFDQVVQESEISGAHVRANLERAALRQLYQKSKIFWHAAGFDEDDNAHPELFEHFGIVTVEAMAAECVPIVINKGGQREIVQHGVNGFLWNTLEELTKYTQCVAQDEELQKRLAAAARARAKQFSLEVFLARYATLVAQHRED